MNWYKSMTFFSIANCSEKNNQSKIDKEIEKVIVKYDNLDINENIHSIQKNITQQHESKTSSLFKTNTQLKEYCNKKEEEYKKIEQQENM